MTYTQDDINHMKEAVKMSETSTEGELLGGPFGAVIYKDGKCVAKGCNHVLANNDPTAHAEVYTIREACKALKTFDLSGCVLYSSCEPCPMCLMAAKWANLDKVFFAAARQDAADIGFRDEALYQMLKDGVYATPIEACREEAVAAMHRWYQKHGTAQY